MTDRALADEFVGRGEELAVLQRAIADARTGLPSIVLVGGDAGIGKTTIVHESARRADVSIYLGRSTHIGGDTIPFAPLADLLRQVRRLAPGVAVTELSAGTEGGVFTTVLELLVALSAEDAVLVGFEDLHWADSATWDLFEFLARNLIDEQVVLVGTYRTNQVAADQSQRGRLAELSRLPGAHRFDLHGLDRDEVAARISSLTGSTAPPDLVEEVMRRGQGNPFFTNALVAAYMAGEAIPAVLSDLISCDIAGLDEDSRLVLGAVAAVGRDTPHALLAAVVGLADRELEAALRTVVDDRVLVVDNHSYRFRHPLLAEVVYTDLLPPQRLRLHRKIAEVLEGDPASVRSGVDRAGELAFHLDKAGEPARAFVALLAAADAAESVAPAAAFAHLERAFQLWDAAGAAAAPAERAQRLWQAAEVATTTVGNARAAMLARAALEAGPPPFGIAWGHERLGRYLWSSGQLDASRREFERAAELLADDDSPSAALVYAGLGQAALMAGEYTTARRWTDRVFELAPNPGHNPAAWVMARRVLGIALSNEGDPESAVELCRQAVGAATNAQTRALATLYLCVALLDAGRNSDAINTALDAVAEGQLTGLDHGFLCYFDSVAAEALLRLGRWPEADAVLSRNPVPSTLPVGHLRLARAQAMLAARRGDKDVALNRLDEALALSMDGWHQSVLDAAAADVHLALGNWDTGRRVAERGWDSSHTTSVLWAARFAMFGAVATVEQTLDCLARRESVDVAATVAALRERIDTVRSSAGDLQLDTAAHLSHATASVSRLTAPDPDAWGDAAARWTELGDRWATATALVREAEAAAMTGSADRAASSLRTAHSIASELGAVPLLAEIVAVSRRTRVSVAAPTRVAIDETSAHDLGLTAREAEVLTLVAAGRTNRQIGEELYVSEKTASVHVSNILRKLGVSTRVDAAAVAQRLKLT